MADVVTWILDAVLRLPPTRFNSIQVPDNLHAVFTFDARSNLDYVAQFRSSLTLGNWTTLNDFSSAATNRSIRYTNNTGGAISRSYRLKVGP
jgi:hypothetical protein